jgi:hypothetical protein
LKREREEGFELGASHPHPHSNPHLPPQEHFVGMEHLPAPPKRGIDSRLIGFEQIY